MDPLFVLITWVVWFFAGIGVGTFVLGSRIRKVVAEAFLYAKKEEAALVSAVNAGKYAIESEAKKVISDIKEKI